MRKNIAFILALVMLFSLAACGAKRESAQSVAEKAIQAVQKLDSEQMQKYWGTSTPGTDVQDLSELDGECVKAMYKNLTYEIVSSEEKESSAIVNVKFTNINIPQALSDTFAAVLPQILQYAFSGEEYDEDSMVSEAMLNCLNNSEYDKVTKPAVINLTLKDDAWVIDTSNSDDVFNAMLADVNSFGESFGQSGDENKDLISEVRNWVVDDVWNSGICDMKWYYANGTSATGETLDPEFTLSQLAKAMEKKADYDAKMSALPEEYSEISELWTKLSDQIDVLYAEIQTRGTTRDGSELDVGLYNQYFDAFDDAVYSLD